MSIIKELADLPPLRPIDTNQPRLDEAAKFNRARISARLMGVYPTNAIII